MSRITPGRHRAPNRLSTASSALTRTARATAVAATSGGLLAAAVVPATAAPRGVVDSVADVPAQSILADHGSDAPRATTGLDLLGITLPVVPEADRPVVAAPAPTDVDRDHAFGIRGFVGITPEPEPEPEPEPAPEPEPEPEPEPAPAEAPAAQSAPSADSGTATSSSSAGTDSDRSQAGSRSSTSERSQTSSSRTQERAAAPAATSAPTPAPATTGGVVGVASQYVGIMYSYGGSSPSSGFDCSGFTSYVFQQVGINLPRSAAGQQSATTPVSNPQPGDLVFWGSPAWHVGIYAGNGMIYDSGTPGNPVRLRPEFSGVSGYGRVG